MDLITLTVVVALSILVALGGTRALIGLLFVLMMRGALQRAPEVASAEQSATASTRYF
jgi:hypothetical protein